MAGLVSRSARRPLHTLLSGCLRASLSAQCARGGRRHAASTYTIAQIAGHPPRRAAPFSSGLRGIASAQGSPLADAQTHLRRADILAAVMLDKSI